MPFHSPLIVSVEYLAAKYVFVHSITKTSVIWTNIFISTKYKNQDKLTMGADGEQNQQDGKGKGNEIIGREGNVWGLV